MGITAVLKVPSRKNETQLNANEYMPPDLRYQIIERYCNLL